jgi:aldose 1-epimerase
MQYRSREMEEGFPGTLTTTIKYTLRENELQYEITAVTDADTIVNLAQHSYFNLNENGETIESHKVKLLAGNYLEQDRDLCVTGKRIPVKDTIYDFTIAKHINRNWDEETGYDQSFVIDEPTSTAKPEMVLAAECWPVLQQCKLEVYTTESIVHLYTGRWIPDIKGKNAMAYGPYSGLCFETQQHPDGINNEGFPSAILKPGEQYYQKNSYKIV